MAFRDDLPLIEQVIKVLYSERNIVLPKLYIDKAIKTADRLLNSQEKKVVLHGDLHQKNIVFSSRDGWVAIDPKGIIGEPAYDVGAFIRNPMPEILSYYQASEVIRHRILLFSRLLRLEPDRLKDWSFVQAVLAAAWALEDSCSWQPWIRCAAIIDTIKIDALPTETIEPHTNLSSSNLIFTFKNSSSQNFKSIDSQTEHTKKPLKLK